MAEQPKKNLPFSPVFSMLGIQVDLTASGNGVVTVRNKPERNAEIRKELLRILEKGSMTRGEASSLHGFRLGGLNCLPSFVHRQVAVSPVDKAIREPGVRDARKISRIREI